jgi:exodeoxyribonuclease VII small subunit
MNTSTNFPEAFDTNRSGTPDLGAATSQFSPSSSSSIADTQDVPRNWNYEATVAKVEAIVDRMESGRLELDEVFNQYSTAVEYLRQCEKFLAQRQQQMDLLIETLVDEPEAF